MTPGLTALKTKKSPMNLKLIKVKALILERAKTVASCMSAKSSPIYKGDSKNKFLVCLILQTFKNQKRFNNKENQILRMLQNDPIE